MNKRPRRLLGALSVTAILVSLALAGPAMATTPDVGHTAQGPVPGTVSPGKIVGYYAQATNNDTSTISQFFFTVLTDGTGYGGTWKTNDGRSGSCVVTSGVLNCAFGQVKPGVTVNVTAAIRTPNPATDSTTNCDPTFVPTPGVDFSCADLQWSTTGFVPGKNSSHGDSFNDYRVVTLNNSSNFAGQFAFDRSLLALSDGTNSGLGNGNKQNTSINGSINGSNLPTGLGLTVGDGQQNTPANNGCVTTHDLMCPTTFFGEVSVVTVTDQNGVSFDGTPSTFFQITLQLYKPGVNASQVNGVYHSWTDGSVFHQELINFNCPNGPSSAAQVPCFSATKLGAQNVQIAVWTFHNGKLGGF